MMMNDVLHKHTIFAKGRTVLFIAPEKILYLCSASTSTLLLSPGKYNLQQASRHRKYIKDNIRIKYKNIVSLF